MVVIPLVSVLKKAYIDSLIYITMHAWHIMHASLPRCAVLAEPDNGLKYSVLKSGKNSSSNCGNIIEYWRRSSWTAASRDRGFVSAAVVSTLWPLRQRQQPQQDCRSCSRRHRDSPAVLKLFFHLYHITLVFLPSHSDANRTPELKCKLLNALI